jgi:hypothetical protein
MTRHKLNTIVGGRMRAKQKNMNAVGPKRPSDFKCEGTNEYIYVAGLGVGLEIL